MDFFFTFMVTGLFFIIVIDGAFGRIVFLRVRMYFVRIGLVCIICVRV